jgi:hypothetical protein
MSHDQAPCQGPSAIDAPGPFVSIKASYIPSIISLSNQALGRVVMVLIRFAVSLTDRRRAHPAALFSSIRPGGV